ncbi:uncharacterized protein LOC119386840 [Rhipicephalus sanguineus]|uniref:uncharacterized protein LOC119386840 n=1 Tax=Rhipicephalus sanguineus TaxID=34632 RepID=UPI0018960E02|nr:uncharacterized protein LOC119386840 [Rhipicephalus sanguineus]
MKSIFAATCLLGLVVFTANSHALPERKSSVEVAFESAAQEAIYLSEILNDVGDALAEDEELKAASEEYFIRDLWAKAKEALKNATQKAASSVKGAYDEAKGHIQKAATEAQRRLKEKAAEIMSKILTKITSQYAVEDSISPTDVMQIVLDLIKAAAQRLFNVGKALEHIEH